MANLIQSQNPVATSLPIEREFKLGYRNYLDGMRGIAVLLVMLFHTNWRWVRGGFIGVDVFFVLSGFLITTLLLEEWECNGFISLKKFYARRALRLIPALLTLILVYSLIQWLWGEGNKGKSTIQAILAALFYVMNWTLALGWKNTSDVSPLGHTWSLSMEEQFYLVWPLLLFFLMRFKSPRWLTLTLLSLAAAFPSVLRFAFWHDISSSPRTYFAFDTHADGLILGCLTGLAASWNVLPKSLLWRRLIAILALVAFFFLLYFIIWFPFTRHYPTTASFLYKAGGFTWVNLSVTGILIHLIISDAKFVKRFLEWKRLVWVGKLSYGLYLWHVPMLSGLFSFGIIAGFEFLTTLIYEDFPFFRMALAFAIASLSYYYVEQPFLRMKKRFSHKGDIGIEGKRENVKGVPSEGLLTNEV